MNYARDLYKEVDFSNRNTLKQLLSSMAQFKNTGYANRSSMFDRVEPHNEIYTSVMLLYMDLESLIGRTDLTERNRRLIALVMNGYSINYIYSNFENYNKEATIKMYNRTLDKIIEKYKEEGGKSSAY